jgi:hypothetical protein
VLLTLCLCNVILKSNKNVDNGLSYWPHVSMAVRSNPTGMIILFAIVNMLHILLLFLLCVCFTYFVCSCLLYNSSLGC